MRPTNRRGGEGVEVRGWGGDHQAQAASFQRPKRHKKQQATNITLSEWLSERCESYGTLSLQAEGSKR